MQEATVILGAALVAAGVALLPAMLGSLRRGLRRRRARRLRHAQWEAERRASTWTPRDDSDA